MLNLNFDRPKLILKLVALMGMLCFCTQVSMASERAVKFKEISKMLGGWKSSQHLYVKGDLKVSRQSLDVLEQWLDKKGNNWTVILMRNARGQVWKDMRGYKYHGMDAVENAVGRGLSNNERFAGLLDSSDGKRNGAIFVLFLDERKFSYFGEESYDIRFLGEDAWSGNLDSSAQNAMRSGGGVVNAVKDTIKTIDRKLRNAKAAEARIRERAKIQKKETEAWVKREAEIMLRNLKVHAKRSRAIKAVAGAQDGGLANPPLNDWQRVISESQGNPNPFLAKQALMEVSREMKKHRVMMRAWHVFPDDLRILEKKMLGFSVDQNFPKGKDMFRELAEKLQAVKISHKRGERRYYTELLDVKKGMQWLSETNERVKGERIRKELYEAEQREANRVATEQRAKTLKIATVTGTSALGAGFLCFGVFTNRRRKKRKILAEKLHGEWEEAMKERVDRLFQVMDRAAIVVGSERDLPERGYKGETLKRSLAAIKNIDRAFVLTASVDKVLNDTEELIYPNGISSKSVNLFSRARYDDALDMLQRKPLGSYLDLSEVQVMNRGEAQMLGGRENAENMELNFTELIVEFDEAVADADADLNAVEQAWEIIGTRTEELGDVLFKISGKDELLENLAKSDGLFRMNILFDEWLPKAEAYQLEAIDIGRSDPISALGKQVTMGERMSEEMNLLVSSIVEFRSSQLEVIADGARNLHEIRRRNDWVNERLEFYDEELGVISHRGMNESVRGILADHRELMFSFKGEVELACKLAKTSLAVIPKLLEKAKAKTISARSEIAKVLSLAEDEILKESDVWNPDLLLTEAERLRVSTQLCLDDGKTQQAQDLCEQSQRNIDEANTVIADALLASGNYERDFTLVNELLKEAGKLKDAGVVIMSNLVGEYCRAALQIDPENKGAGNFIEVEEALQSTYTQLSRDIVSAKDYQKKGWVLHAEQDLIHAKNAHEHVRGMHEFISFRKRELVDLERKNLLMLETHERGLRSLDETMDDPRVTVATQRFSRELDGVFERVSDAVDAEHGESNPFVTEILLDEMKQRILALETRIQSDRESFAAAETALARLTELYEQSRILMERSESDEISNSEETEDCISEIERSADLIEAHNEFIGEAHNHWSNLYDEMHISYEFLSSAVSRLNKDLGYARAALANVRSASRSVSKAMHWSGSYGVSIMGAYGSDELDQARYALDRGEYEEATNYAANAQREARSAVSFAESRVASIRHQREEAARARRRARSAARDRMNSSGLGGVASSGLSFSSRSSSRSSGRSSNSGFSRSGW